jgi:hypothetical protein
MDRGKIINRNFASQIRDFSGLRFGNITPTDIDGFIDFQNNCFIVMEFKHKDSKLPFGQKLAIERLVDNLEAAGKKCIGIVAEHDTSGDIDCANCYVREYRYRKQWYPKPIPTTVKQLIDKFLKLTVTIAEAHHT